MQCHLHSRCSCVWTLFVCAVELCPRDEQSLSHIYYLLSWFGTEIDFNACTHVWNMSFAARVIFVCLVGDLAPSARMCFSFGRAWHDWRPWLALDLAALIEYGIVQSTVSLPDCYVGWWCRNMVLYGALNKWFCAFFCYQCDFSLQILPSYTRSF